MTKEIFLMHLKNEIKISKKKIFVNMPQKLYI